MYLNCLPLTTGPSLDEAKASKDELWKGFQRLNKHGNWNFPIYISGKNLASQAWWPDCKLYFSYQALYFPWYNHPFCKVDSDKITLSLVESLPVLLKNLISWWIVIIRNYYHPFRIASPHIKPSVNRDLSTPASCFTAALISSNSWSGTYLGASRVGDGNVRHWHIDLASQSMVE